MEIKPTSFSKAMPAEERNGFYGLEEELIESAGGEPVVAVVTYVVDEVISKEIAGVRYPVLKPAHVEPILNEKDAASALKLQGSAYKARTGRDALDLGDVG